MVDSLQLLLETKTPNTTFVPNLDYMQTSSPIVDLYHENNIDVHENKVIANSNSDAMSESLKNYKEDVKKELEKQSMYTSYGISDVYNQKLTPKDEQFNFIYIVLSFLLLVMLCVIWLKIKLSLNEE